GTEQIPMVCNGQRFLNQSTSLGKEFIEFRWSIQHRIFGVGMLVYETIALCDGSKDHETVDHQIRFALASVSLALVTYTTQRIRQVDWILGGIAHVLAGDRMFKAKANSMQPLTCKS